MSAPRGPSALALVTLAVAGFWAPPLQAARPALEPLPALDLEAMDPEVGRQLEEARAAVTELAAADQTLDPDLGRAYGFAGQLYLLYDIVEGARAGFRNATALAPDVFDFHYYLGTVYQEEGRLEDAVRSFERALELSPSDVPTLVRLGRSELDLDRTESAARRFERALEVNPGSAAALYGLGQVALEGGRHRAAVDYFETVLEAQPQAAAAHYQLALAYRSLGEMERAREHFARQGREGVRFDDPLMSRLGEYARGAGILIVGATRARARGDLEGAAAGFRAALAADADNASARLALASTLIQLGDLDSAIGELREVLRRDPLSASGHYNLGTALAYRGETETALGHLERATELAPGFPDAWVNLAGLRGRQGRFQDAADAYSRALALEPADAGLRLQMVDARSRAGRHEEALAELAPLLDRDPRPAPALLARGAIEERTGRPDAARATYEQVLELDVEAAARGSASLRLGSLLAAGGDSSAAIGHLERARELLPESVEGRLSLARLYGRERRFGDAADAFAEAVRLAPDSAEARFGGSLALLLAARYSEARDLLEESVRRLPESLPLKNTLARLLATCPEDDLRDGARALRLAQETVSRELRIEYAETVGMAMAELARFGDAVALQRRVIQQAERAGDPALVERLRRNLELYESGRAKRAPWLDG